MEALRELTNSIIREDGFWRKDAEKIEILQKKRQDILSSGLGLPRKSTGFWSTASATARCPSRDWPGRALSRWSCCGPW